jgi:hypothetical protein
MTPISIEILLKCYYSPEPLEFIDSTVTQEIVREFMDDGLIELGDESGCFKATEKGRAHVEQLCNLPYPVAVWIGGNGKPIYPEKKP